MARIFLLLLNTSRPGFPQVLEQAYTIYKTGKSDLEIRAKKIIEKLCIPESSSTTGKISAHLLIDEAARIMEERFDWEEGRFWVWYEIS